MYNVYDTTGHIVRGYFKSWIDAHTFICINNRFDWSIKHEHYWGKKQKSSRC